MKLVCAVFLNDTATTEIYTLSLHDALPISVREGTTVVGVRRTAHGYHVATDGADWHARNVVIATGDCDLPRIPACAADRKSTRLNSSHANISYAVFCLKKKKHSSMYLHSSE